MIQQKVKSVKTSGIPYEEWQDYKPVYANMFIRRGEMRETENSSIPVVQVEWTIRYRDDINYDNRISYEGHKYNIEFIEVLGRKEGIKIISQVLKFDNEK